MARPRRLSAAPLLAAALALLSGCSRQGAESAPRRPTPFVFQALNLRQQDGQGRLLWRVSSPEARYDLSRHLAQARQLRGEIHVNGQALYRLLASHGTVINDGQVIQLEGDVRIERFGPDPVTIRASRMRWYPQQQRIELDRRAEASNPQLLLQAQRATLLLAQDRLELRGQPRLQRRPSNGPESGLSLRVNALDWSPGNGRLTACLYLGAFEPHQRTTGGHRVAQAHLDCGHPGRSRRRHRALLVGNHQQAHFDIRRAQPARRIPWRDLHWHWH